MGTPRVSSLVHGIASLPRPSEDPSVRPKTSPGASRDLESSHSISIGDGAVGPPRSGFVLRLCIRKADGARSEAALGHGLADTRFCRTAGPTLTGASRRAAHLRRFRPTGIAVSGSSGLPTAERHGGPEHAGKAGAGEIS